MLNMNGVEATDGKQDAAVRRRTDNTMVKRQGLPVYQQTMVDNKNTHKTKD